MEEDNHFVAHPEGGITTQSQIAANKPEVATEPIAAESEVVTGPSTEPTAEPEAPATEPEVPATEPTDEPVVEEPAAEPAE